MIDQIRLKNYDYVMYRRPKFLEILIAVREEMARKADYDVDLFAEMVRSSHDKKQKAKNKITGEIQVQAEESLIEEDQSGKLKPLNLGIEIDKTRI